MDNGIARVLLVDDDKECLKIFSIRVEELGLTSVSANNGAEALEILATDSIDLVLCDVMMPGMDGIQLVRSIREMESCQNLPVIMLTVLNENEKLDEAFEAGANDYLTKFSEKGVFKARIRNCLKLKQTLDRVIDAERQRVVLESMRAACHHLAQPMTGVLANLESFILDLPEDPEEVKDKIRETLRWSDKICDLIVQMRSTRQYKTMPFLDGKEILDISIEKSEK